VSHLLISKSQFDNWHRVEKITIEPFLVVAVRWMWWCCSSYAYRFWHSPSCSASHLTRGSPWCSVPNSRHEMHRFGTLLGQVMLIQSDYVCHPRNGCVHEGTGKSILEWVKFLSSSFRIGRKSHLRPVQSHHELFETYVVEMS
jgi:hypothetical protein